MAFGQAEIRGSLSFSDVETKVASKFSIKLSIFSSLALICFSISSQPKGEHTRNTNQKEEAQRWAELNALNISNRMGAYSPDRSASTARRLLFPSDVRFRRF